MKIALQIVCIILAATAFGLFWDKYSNKLNIVIKLLLLVLLLAAPVYWAYDDLRFAFIASIWVVGEMYYIASVAIMYNVLKDNKYRIRWVPKKEWIKFAKINVYVWGIYILVLPDGILLCALITISLVLIVLLIYDIITDIFRF